MKIDRNGLIAGQPARKVRDVLRRLRDNSITVEGFAERLAISQSKARRFVAAMLELRLLERCEPYPLDRAARYQSSREGLRLASALWLKRLNRAKAERIVRDMLDRADTINADEDLVYRVTAIDAFGSYVSGAVDLGDIDLVPTLQFKPEKGPSIAAANTARAEACGRDNLDLISQLGFGWIEVCRRLKARNPYLKFHSFDEIESLDIATVRIYPRASKAVTK